MPVDGNPLAGLNSLARQVRRCGVRRVSGNVVIDDRLFETFFGWPDVTVSPLSPIIVNDNRIDITAIPGPRAGTPATIRWRPRTVAAGRDRPHRDPDRPACVPGQRHDRRRRRSHAARRRDPQPGLTIAAAVAEDGEAIAAAMQQGY